MADERGISRRDFLKGVGALPAVAGVIGAGARGLHAGEKTAESYGPGAVPLTLNVNGKDCGIHVPPRTTLLNALRTHLNITGPKEACNTGACGACTVLLDGVPVNACLMLAIDAAGRKVVTVEGLARDEKLAPIQEACVTHDGMQCGYCTPGFLCSLSALFARKPKPNGQEIREACAGNLCRCAAYNRIFAAAEAVAEGKPAGDIVCDGALLALGGEKLKDLLERQGVPRLDAPDKVTGRARYSSDQRPHDLLYLRAIVSPYAQAKVVGKPDLASARGVAGVREAGVLETAPHMGAPVAYAVADDPQAADAALAALALTLEPQAANVDPEKAFAEGKAEPARGSASPERAAEALKKCDQVVEGTFVVQTVQHCCLEPHGSVARWEGDRLTVYESTQAVCGSRDAIAKQSRAGDAKTRLLCDYTGGGFGSKLGMWSETPRAVAIAKKLGAPVHYFASRAAELVQYGGRQPQVVHVRLGAQKDGTIAAEHRKVLGRAGSYWYDVPLVATEVVQGHVAGHGTFPPLRGPGHPEMQFVMESIVEDLANALAMDPLELRLKNRPNLKEWFTRGAKAIGWERRQPTGAQKGEVRGGFGVGCGDFAGMRGCHFIEVEVDMGTGVVRVVKAVAVMQGGFVNRMGTLSQIYGGTVMGMSWALLEERILDRATGGMVNANLDTYKIAGAKDVPEIEVILIGQQGSPSGCGEAPAVPVGGALRNAIVNATGRPLYRMPFSPRNVLASMA